MRSASSAPTASRSSHPTPVLRTVSRRPRAAVSGSFSPVGPSTATGRCSAWSLRPSSPPGYPKYRSRRLPRPSLRVGGRLSSSLDPASAQNRETVHQELLVSAAQASNFPKLPRQLDGSRVRRYGTDANPRKPSSCRSRPRPTFEWGEAQNPFAILGPNFGQLHLAFGSAADWNCLLVNPNYVGVEPLGINRQSPTTKGILCPESWTW